MLDKHHILYSIKLYYKRKKKNYGKDFSNYQEETTDDGQEQ